MLEKHSSAFSAKVYDRCCYVIKENKRVLDAAKDLEKGDLNSFGTRMYETHEGLSELYEVSCNELDFLVNESKKIEGVLGARMMGGGFGGCTINLVSKSAVENFIDSIRKAYKEQFNVIMNTYVVSIKDGTGLVSPSS
jgi:galactokinase